MRKLWLMFWEWIETRQRRKLLTDDNAMPPFTCPVCGSTSYNFNDITNRYCGYCKRFFDDGTPESN
jgi:hypothetical protein